MHADVGRNFLAKEAVLTLLEVMSMYKLNKFHFHLTDDEGWRLEIPGIEELTEVNGCLCRNCVSILREIFALHFLLTDDEGYRWRLETLEIGELTEVNVMTKLGFIFL